jgi:2-polyprenyl-6-methoxyphenol hydroxylase-like FAD-dependent oxidoreductase
VLRSDGGLANYSANNANLSDRREKKNFSPAKSYLETICAIPVQTFNYIDQTDELPNLGVVAQDVQAVAPELVSESDWSAEKDNSKIRLSVYQTDLQYALMKSIQELKAINDTQAETINALTARIVALEK